MKTAVIYWSGTGNTEAALTAIPGTPAKIPMFAAYGSKAD